jgi:hypothetical protein
MRVTGCIKIKISDQEATQFEQLNNEICRVSLRREGHVPIPVLPRPPGERSGGTSNCFTKRTLERGGGSLGFGGGRRLKGDNEIDGGGMVHGRPRRGGKEKGVDKL